MLIRPMKKNSIYSLLSCLDKCLSSTPKRDSELFMMTMSLILCCLQWTDQVFHRH